MNLTRKHALAGLAATGIVASALAGGGVAVASTGPTPTPTMTAPAPGHYKCGYGHRHGQWPGHQAVEKAVAGYLGLSPAQVRSQLGSGKSLADIAKAQGKPVSGLEGTILGAVTTQVNASPYLSAAGKAAAINEVKSHLGSIVNATCTPGMSPSPTSSPMSPYPTGTK
jgi:hypothetical protein